MSEPLFEPGDFEKFVGYHNEEADRISQFVVSHLASLGINAETPAKVLLLEEQVERLENVVKKKIETNRIQVQVNIKLSGQLHDYKQRLDEAEEKLKRLTRLEEFYHKANLELGVTKLRLAELERHNQKALTGGSISSQSCP